jgi:hypothetical protein
MKRVQNAFKLTWEVFSGRRIPAEVLEGGTIFSTRMRLKVGIKRFAISE